MRGEGEKVTLTENVHFHIIDDNEPGHNPESTKKASLELNNRIRKKAAVRINADKDSSCIKGDKIHALIKRLPPRGPLTLALTLAPSPSSTQDFVCIHYIR